MKDRHKAAKFYQDALGYKIATEFLIDFGGEDGTAECLVLIPPERKTEEKKPWICNVDEQEYHIAPEIFISDGSENSIVGKWVKARGGIGGLHHFAYAVESVENTMKEWIDCGYAEFSSDAPFHCEGLTQCFTKPSELTGVIIELIQREEQGFCQKNVLNLMKSTANLDVLMEK